EVVADQQERSTLSGEQFQYIVGECGVECAGRLVRECHSRGVCAGGDQCRALQHATGPLVRVLSGTIPGVVNTDGGQAGVDGPRRWAFAMARPGFRDMMAHWPQRVAGSVRVLRNVSEPATTDVP